MRTPMKKTEACSQLESIWVLHDCFLVGPLGPSLLLFIAFTELFALDNLHIGICGVQFVRHPPPVRVPHVGIPNEHNPSRFFLVGHLPHKTVCGICALGRRHLGLSSGSGLPTKINANWITFCSFVCLWRTWVH